MLINEDLINKWKEVLDHGDLPKINEAHRRNSTAVLLENTEKFLREQRGQRTGGGMLFEDAPINSTGTSVDNYDPILISLVRRAMPNLIAYDICGVQPMTGPTGLIFAMRSHYANQAGTEAFYDEANTAFSALDSTPGAGTNTNFGGANLNIGTVPTGNSETYNFAAAMNTATAEALGGNSTTLFADMAFSIDKISVTAGSRALKAEYTMELVQDLKAIHGLDAETELANILQSEILAEINREVVRSIYLSAKTGANTGTTTAGIFDLDTDSNGRWSVEKFKGLMFQVERESNQIAKDTRRGKGNIIMCSSDVASALQMAGVLDYAPALASNNLQVDDTGNTFAGVLNGRTRVYVDPYSTSNYMVVGYKGANAFDAGLFYCPYIPLQMVRAVGQDNFQPRIGFKTRYGMVANPFSRGATRSDGSLVQNVNVYYRRVTVNNLM